MRGYRYRAWVVAILVLASSVSIPSGPAVAAGCTRSRPFGVGTITLRIVDRRRDRVLHTTVAYPARRGSSGEGAPPACGRFPLVIAGHGSQGDGASAVSLHHYLAVDGAVVAGPTFPGSIDLRAFARDIRVTITKILARDRRSNTPLEGSIRRRRIGYIGTSLGAIVGFVLYQRCCDDARIDAVVAKAGYAPAGTYAWGRGPALLMLNGTQDTVIPYEQARRTYGLATSPKGLITLEGIDHSLRTGADPILTKAPLAFFDRFLHGRAGGLRRLRRVVRDSEIATLRAAW